MKESEDSTIFGVDRQNNINQLLDDMKSKADVDMAKLTHREKQLIYCKDTIDEVLKRLSEETGFICKANSVEVDYQELYNTGSDSKLDLIIYTVSKVLGIPPIKITSKRQDGYIVEARYICFYLASEYTSLSQENIGSKFSGKNHSSVSIGLDKYESFRNTDKMFDRKAQECIDEYLNVLNRAKQLFTDKAEH